MKLQQEENDDAIIIWNLPRTICSSYISYQAIESIKDGLICNNKFECGSFICNSPHVVIFANCLPEFDKLSIDRWNIYKVNNNKLIRVDITDLMDNF